MVCSLTSRQMLEDRGPAGGPASCRQGEAEGQKWKKLNSAQSVRRLSPLFRVDSPFPTSAAMSHVTTQTCISREDCFRILTQHFLNSMLRVCACGARYRTFTHSKIPTNCVTPTQTFKFTHLRSSADFFLFLLQSRIFWIHYYTSNLE